MPNIGATGFILIILVALLLFGPSKLPELGRAFGRTLREFKNGAKEIIEDDDADRKELNRPEARRLDSSRPEYRAGDGAQQAQQSQQPQHSQSGSGNDKRLPE